MWWLFGTAVGCLIVGYRVGHWRGLVKCRTELMGDIRRFIGAGKMTASEENIMWCYRNILNRDPENVSILRDHAKANENRPTYKIAEDFMQTPEFERQNTIGKEKARQAFEHLKKGVWVRPSSMP